MKVLRKKFGELLKARRKEKGFKSQESFAERIGVLQNTVARWESGRFLPDEAHLEKICIVLDVGPDYFVEASIEKASDLQATLDENSKTLAEIKRRFEELLGKQIDFNGPLTRGEAGDLASENSMLLRELAELHKLFPPDFIEAWKKASESAKRLSRAAVGLHEKPKKASLKIR